MRKLRLDNKGLSPLVAVIVLLTLVMVLGAIIAGTLSGAPRPVLPATTAVNLMTPYGGNPAAGDDVLIIRHEYGQPIDEAYAVSPYEFQIAGNGTTEWTTDQAHSGSHSALLTVLAGGIPNAARVAMPSPVATVDEILDVSVEYYLTDDSTTASSPYIILELDTNGDGVKDTWAVSVQDDGVDTGAWLTHTATNWHLGTGTPPWKTLSEVKAVVGSATILKVKVAVGEWGMTGKTSAYVDDITINDVTYDLEPFYFPQLEWVNMQLLINGAEVLPTIVYHATEHGALVGSGPMGISGRYAFAVGDQLKIELPRPLESSDLIQLVYEPRDLMLVEYLVQ